MIAPAEPEPVSIEIVVELPPCCDCDPVVPPSDDVEVSIRVV